MLERYFLPCIHAQHQVDCRATPQFLMKEHTTILEKWTNHDFFAPDTVVLGIDIGIEGIGIAIRKGTELVYCKTLLVDLPEAEALAQRRQYRAARHARKNYRVRMRRLKELFAKHDLPWVENDVYSRSDAYILRHRALRSKLASKEALSLCIRSCVARRGYDYYALTGHSSGEYPWGTSLDYTEAAKWVRSAYVDSTLKELLLNLTTELQDKKGNELDEAASAEWVQLIEERFTKAEQEGIPAKLHQYAHTHRNDRKFRGNNYPRAHVAEHLLTILRKHQDMFHDFQGFVNALFLPCTTKQEKKHAIFYYNRKTPEEATDHFAKKIKTCPYCSLVNIPHHPCGLNGDMPIRRWKLVDFLSNRRFDLAFSKQETRRCTLPESAVTALVAAIEQGCGKWADIKKNMEDAMAPIKLTKGGDWNKIQLEHLKDICAPMGKSKTGRAGISDEAAQELYNQATDGGSHLAPSGIETWKKEWNLYGKRAEIDAIGGIYPQVQTLLGTLRIRQGKSDGTFATTGFLQRLFAEKATSLGGKTAPDYCVIECVKSPAANTKKAAEIQKAQNDNRQKKLKLLAKYGCDHPKNADFLRMALFEEQGGSLKSEAICPFTGESLGSSPFSNELELAHLYPDTKGGLYIDSNLVLTKRKTNADMGPRTPREAAAAGLPGWLAWNDMLKLSAKFKWNDKKRELFAFEPTDERSFPDFNNMTRTAQLARELRRLVAVWMGVDKNPEYTRTRIGNPSGTYTAAARRGMLWPDYTKDRCNNLHHRLDAAVMTCIPPAEGLNNVCYGGIFYTDKSTKHRVLTTITGLPLPDFYAMWTNAAESPVIKKQSRSKSKSLGDATFWSVDKENKTHQRTKLDPAKYTAAELFSTLAKMGIPTNRIPSEKELQRWLVDCQAATKADETTAAKPLRLKMSPGGKGKGVQVKNIWKYGSKGNLDNSPLGWNGIITDNGKFDQLRSLDGSCDRLELWLGWNTKKARWEYYKRTLPTGAALAGLKRLGLPWRGTKGAPTYLLDLLKAKKKRDLMELATGTILPPHAIKVATFKKGDIFSVIFPVNEKALEKLRSKDVIFKEEEHPSIIRAWGRVSAVKSALSLEMSCLMFKDRKKTEISDASKLAILVGLPGSPNDMAQQLKLTPPV